MTPCCASYPAAPPKLAIYETLKRILNALVTDLMKETRRQVCRAGRDDVGRDSPAPASAGGA